MVLEDIARIREVQNYRRSSNGANDLVNIQIGLNTKTGEIND